LSLLWGQQQACVPFPHHHLTDVFIHHVVAGGGGRSEVGEGKRGQSEEREKEEGREREEEKTKERRREGRERRGGERVLEVLAWWGPDNTGCLVSGLGF